jgi:hypothetical protein
MTESESLVYRVVPKCACSTIGQIMFYSDHGTGSSTATSTMPPNGLHKWALPDNQPTADRDRAVKRASGRGLHLRPQPLHPDPVVLLRQDLQASSATVSRYRGNLDSGTRDPEVRHRGTAVPDGKDDFDQIASFRRFLLFARDTIRWKKPMDPDIHWSSMAVPMSPPSS